MAGFFILCSLLCILPPDVAGQSARAHLERGARHLERREADPAIRELKSAVALDSKSARAHMLLGQAYLAKGFPEFIAEAKAELQQALELEPQLLWARFYLAKIHFDLGRYEKAKIELDRAMQQQPNTSHVLSLLGEVERRLGNPERAADLEKKALAVDPAMTPAHYYLALAYLDLKREDDALRELESAVRSSYVTPEIYIELGSLYVRKGERASAAEQFRKAIALDPARPEGRIRLAGIYRLERDYGRALDELQRAAPEGKQFLNSPYYQELLADVAFERGRVYQDRKEPSEAIGAYLKALEINPEHGRAHRQLAELFAAQGETAKAHKHAEQAERLEKKP